MQFPDGRTFHALRARRYSASEDQHGRQTHGGAGQVRAAGVVLCGILAVLAASRAADAQVMEIQDDGSVVTLSGPSGAQPPRAAARRVGGAADGAVVQDLRQASARYGLSEPLLEAVARRESGLRQNAVSPKGARGVMQLMPATAQSLGVSAADRHDNIAGGAAYLADLLRRFDGDLVRALAAYNAGPKAVERFGGVPPYAETKAYVNAILDYLADASVGLVKEGAH